MKRNIEAFNPALLHLFRFIPGYCNIIPQSACS
nr:MAG TPA: hypothetical protein [Caudoviricetes sp.]